MRVATHTITDNLVQQFSKLTVRQNALQTQAATGQRVRNLADDPGAARRVLELQGDSGALRQYQENIHLQHEKTTVGYEAMRGLQRVVDRAAEIAIGADDTKSPDELKLMAVEVTQLIQTAVSHANTRHRDDYLFAGTRSNQPAFDLSLNADDTVASVTYQGNDKPVAVEIDSGTTLSVQPPGANTGSTGMRGLVSDAASGADLFTHLIALQDALIAGDAATVRNVVTPDLQKDEENILHNIAHVGAAQARLEAAESLGKTRLQSNEQLISIEADADLADTLVRLNEVQNAYRAALQSGGTILRLSLLDHL